MTKTQKATFALILNIIIWLCIIALPFVFFPYKRDFSPWHSHRFVYWFIFSTTYLLTFFYTNQEIFINRLLAKKKILGYVLVILGCFFLYLFVMYWIGLHAEETKEWWARRNAASRMQMGGGARPPRSLYFFSPGSIALFLLSFLGSSVGKIVNQWFLAEESKEELGRQQLQTELAMLKSQVNPHFLFNTLNSIYSLALINDDKTSDAVMKLSKIMRYTLEESQRDLVSLTSEVDFIRSYIDLQKLRMTDKVNVVFKTENIYDYVQVPSLLFNPFVENAFKYGVSTHHASEIDIQLAVKDNKVVFDCINDVFTAESRDSTGTGIRNAERRLTLIFGKNFNLSHAVQEGKYYVHLSFPMSK